MPVQFPIHGLNNDEPGKIPRYCYQQSEQIWDPSKHVFVFAQGVPKTSNLTASKDVNP